MNLLTLTFGLVVGLFFLAGCQNADAPQGDMMKCMAYCEENGLFINNSETKVSGVCRCSSERV